MADPTELQDSWVRMERDLPRNRLRKDSAWTLQDVIPNLGAALRGRGGWQNASNDISATYANSDYVHDGIYAPFSAGAQNLVIAQNAGSSQRLLKFASDGTVTDIGALTFENLRHNPVFHRDKVIIAYGSGSAPQKYNGSAISSLGGSPPSAMVSEVWLDRTILARSAANLNRIWFSDAGDPEGWDTASSYWDMSYPITGLKALRSVLLVFHDGYISRLIGSTPPPGGDLRADDPMFTVGCSDPRCIATYGDRVIFANGEGVFITDGSAKPANLTELCGMQTYWRENMVSYGGLSTHGIAAGVYQNYYFITVFDSGLDPVVCGMIDLERLSWVNLANLDAICYWANEATADELYFGRGNAARVGRLSSIFQPQSAYKNDGDGDAVASVIETKYYEGDPGEKAWKRLRVGYQLTDHASDNPTLTVSYAKTPEATGYTAISGTLGENTKRAYGKRELGIAADGLAVKIQQANAGDFRLWSLEADVHRREGSRRAA